MIELIVGLGNPGPKYASNRHNVGAQFIARLADQAGAVFRSEKKFKGNYCKIDLCDRSIHLLFPTTYMNESGQAVLSVCQFFKFQPEQLLVVHDELDLPPGQARLKFKGGHGGHNGLRSIIEQLGSQAFYRLRLGIGHPGHSKLVTNYVLSDPGKEQADCFRAEMAAAEAILPLVLRGEFQAAMQILHTE